MPTNSPDRFKSGPPLLPGLITVSVWIKSKRVTPLATSKDLPKAEITPTVTVGPPGRARALPIAITQSPTRGLLFIANGK